ncbi:MAG: PspA/IM30 family protein [Proteobacteria bacterium]|nr:PspA/IM30 family protein [Pseudomonadota bacterium]MBU1231974.1 PspA/IM30 family protein [Pseudomonadota bacterium]MBU1418997.1 PspA/IM30 family protein [Pseudomonadota bacterium]MBU1455075.1 PspA/IM30 family protein [Pseudomonadota bacterium]
MKERITGRVGRIISGSFNALVDAVENVAPEIVMEQAIREVDDAIEDVRSELGKTIANKHLANSRLMQINQKCEELSEKIELAVSENRDDLAETAIAQQLDMEAQIPILENQISDLSGKEKELEGYIAALQGKKREMRDELNLYKTSRKDTEKELPTASGKTSSVETKISRAESAFARVLSDTTGFSSGIAATDRKSAAQMNELEDMSRKNRVKERLAAIKGKKG